MCLPKAPKPTTVPERQAEQMPERDARGRATDDSRRRRGFLSLIKGGTALGPVSTTNTLGA